MTQSAIRNSAQSTRAFRAALLVTTALTASVFAASPAGAANWTGAIGDWFDPANWNSGVPTSGDQANINNTGTAQVDADGAAASSVWIGQNAGQSGALEVTGPDAELTASSGVYVGFSGSGTLDISGGGVVNGGGTTIAATGTASGSVTVDGEGSVFNITGFTVGGDGEGTLDIVNGGYVFSTSSAIGSGSIGSGAVTIDGAGSYWESLYTLYVGYEGEATLDISNGGAMSSQGAYVGLQSGSTGAVTVDGEDSIWTNSGELYVAYAGDGTLDITNGGAVSNTNGTIGNGSDSVGSVTVDGEGSTWTNRGILAVGNFGDGSLDITNGGLVESESATIASLFVGTGRVTVDGEDSTFSAGTRLTVGHFGDGALTITDGGTVSAGTVQAGTQDGGSAAILVDGAGSSLNLTWGDSSTLGFWGDAVLTVSNGGSVVAGGQLRLAETAGSTATVNIGAAAGDDATAAGTFAVDSINFGDGDAEIIFNHTDTDFVLASVMTGTTGTLRLIGSGITTFIGNSQSFWGTTSVEAGTLIVDGAIAGAIDVGEARFGGSGLVYNLTLGNGAVFSPGTGAGDVSGITVFSDITFEAGSTYEVDGVAGSADYTAVRGMAHLSDGASVAYVGSGGSYPWYERRSILYSLAGIDGTFGSVTSNYAFLTPDLSYDAHNVYLSLLRNNIDFTDVTQSPNQSGVAGALNGFTLGNPLYDEIVTMTEEEVRAAFDALSGEAYGSAGSAAFASAQQLRDVLQVRLQMFSGGQVAASGYVPAAGDALAADAPAVWGQLFGSWGVNDATATSAKLDRRSSGFLGGADRAVGENARIGFALGYSRSEFDVSARSSSGDSDNVHIAGYVGTELGPVDLDATLGYSYGRAEAERTVIVGGLTNNLAADYDTHTFQASVEAGTDFDLGPVMLTPFAGLGFTHVRSDSFTETGGPAALTIAASENTTGTSTLGLRVRREAGSVALTGSAAWRHAFGDVDPSTRAAFASAPASPFTTRGTPVSENALALGGDVDFKLGSDTTLTLGYAGEYASDARDHGLTAKVRVEF